MAVKVDQGEWNEDERRAFTWPDLVLFATVVVADIGVVNIASTFVLLFPSKASKQTPGVGASAIHLV